MITTLTGILGWIIYVSLGLIALWGTYCVVVIWRRVAEIRFRNEGEQNDMLSQIESQMTSGDFDGAIGTCDGDPRALPQLTALALVHREKGLSRVRHLVTDHFQRDVLADLEYRLSWVQTVIRAAPMVGLLGTVVGMMGAFSKLASGDNVEASMLADDISVALITTACGLAIAIPLVLCSANINVRIRKLEDLVGLGLTQFFDSLKPLLGEQSQPERQPTA